MGTERKAEQLEDLPNGSWHITSEVVDGRAVRIRFTLEHAPFLFFNAPPYHHLSNVTVETVTSRPVRVGQECHALSDDLFDGQPSFVEPVPYKVKDTVTTMLAGYGIDACQQLLDRMVVDGLTVAETGFEPVTSGL